MRENKNGASFSCREAVVTVICSMSSSVSANVFLAGEDDDLSNCRHNAEVIVLLVEKVDLGNHHIFLHNVVVVMEIFLFLVVAWV